MTVVMLSATVVKCSLLFVGCLVLKGKAECLVCVKLLGNKVPTNDDAISLPLEITPF